MKPLKIALILLAFFTIANTGFSQNVNVLISDDTTAVPCVTTTDGLLQIRKVGAPLIDIHNYETLALGVSAEIGFKTGTTSTLWTALIKSIGIDASTARLAFFTGTNATRTNLVERMTILDGGYVGIGTTSPGSQLDVKGILRLSGSTSGYVGFSPAAVAGSTIYTLPSADGTSGYTLKTNGSGTLSWSADNNSGGTVTSITAGTGLSGGTITGSGTISLSSPVSIANGGTAGTATPTAGTIPYGTGTAYAFSAAGTSGQVLTSAGTGTPTWTTPTTGTVTSVTANSPLSSTGGATPVISITSPLPIANGGTAGTATPTTYGVAYGTGSAYAFTAQGTAGQALLSNGATSAPYWGAQTGLLSGGTNAYNAYWTGTNTLGAEQYLNVTRGGLGANMTASTIGEIPYSTSATTYGVLAAGASGTYLRGQGAATAPVWSTLTLPNTTAIGDIWYASGTNAISNLADVATGNALISGGGVGPSW